MVKKSSRINPSEELDIKPIRQLLTDDGFMRYLNNDTNLFQNVIYGNVHGVQSIISDKMNESFVRKYVPLLAASRNQVEVLRLFMSLGISLAESTDEHQRTPLHYAAYNCHLMAAQFLLVEAGLDHSAQDNLGYSAFEYACEGGDVDVMDLILDCADGRPPPPNPAPAPAPPMMRSMARAPAMRSRAPMMAAMEVSMPAPMAPMMSAMEAPMAPMMASMEAPMAPMMASMEAPMAPPMMAAMDVPMPAPMAPAMERSALAARKGNTRAVLRLLDDAWLVREARAGLGSGRNSLLHLLGRRISAQELDKLSDCGLDLTSRNTSGVRAFEEVPPRVLQEFLDLRVTSIPANAEAGETEVYNVMNPFINADHPDLDVSTLIEISNSAVHSPLIFHPVFFGICAIKWKAVRKFYWFVALLAFLFACATSWFTVHRVRMSYIPPKLKTNEVTESNIMIFQIVSSCMLLLLILMEICNMLLHNVTVYAVRYLLAIACVILVLLYMFFFPVEILKANAFFVIFIPWFMFMYHICQHYSFAQYYSNFVQISKTSLKIVIVFGSMPLAFSLIFYIMMMGEQEEGQISAFNYLHSSVIKTIGMMIGDMSMDEFANHFTDLQWSITYTFFILGVALVLYNMVNALAVSDTQKLISRAEVFRMVALTRQIMSAQTWLRRLSRIPCFGFLRAPAITMFIVKCRNYRWTIANFTSGESTLGVRDHDDLHEAEAKAEGIRELLHQVALPCNAKFVRDIQAIAGKDPGVNNAGLR